MRVLVCGGRDYNDRDAVFRELDRIAGVSDSSPLGHPITIIHGNASGADLLADSWSADNWAQTLRFPADWAKHGRAAGPIRNKQMLDEGKPDLVVAFPGGRGTANMIKQAEAAGVRVVRVPATPQGER